MDFGVLPPEVNSGRMYAGAGPGPMLAAAAAWDGLASELTTAATAYETVIADLSGDWHGPSAEVMAAAATPYAQWLSATAAQAEQSAAQAAAAAAAYEAAFAATVPPPVIVANRSLLAMLVATNILGQNTPAIAAAETHYAAMWAQDAAAMYGYAGAAAAATELSAFAPPPATTSTGAPAAQSAAAARAAANSASPIVTDINSCLGSISTILGNLGGAYSPVGTMSNVGTGWLQSMQIVALAQNIPGVLGMLNGPAPITGALGPLSGGYIAWQAPLGAGALGGVTTASSVSALSGQAGLVGSLSVPTSWTTTAPAVKLLGASLPSGTVSAAAPMLAVDGSTGMFSEAALSSLAGRAVGGTTMRTVVGTSARVLDRAPDTEALTTATILVIPVGEE